MNLSGNKFDSDSSYALGQALRALRNLKQLNLSSISSIKFEPILNALKKVNVIEVFDVSSNKINVTPKSPQYADWVSIR